jgi:SAM-dependent methyltransferase
MTSDAAAFREFEHAGWESVVDGYNEAFSSLTCQAIGPLLNAVGAAPGVRLLDLASGPGYVAAAAVERGSSVVGLDFSAAMVASAQQRYPAVEFREGDAEALPFGPDSFAAVVMNFGLLHLGRPEQALAEANRVLRPGGRMAFTVWANPEQAVGHGIALRAIEDHGDLNVPLPPGPSFFRFSAPEECSRVLHEAGFISPHVMQVPQVWRLPSPDALFHIYKDCSVRMAGVLRAQTTEALHTIRAAMREAVAAYTKHGVVELPMPAVLAWALKASKD